MSAVISEVTKFECLPVPANGTDEASWENVAYSHRQAINNAIPPEYLVPKKYLNSLHLTNLREISGILTPREISITSLSATNLLKLIHDQTYTSVEVTKAFCKSAAIAHQAVSILELNNQLQGPLLTIRRQIVLLMSCSKKRWRLR
jgi:hypothetical protein